MSLVSDIQKEREKRALNLAWKVQTGAIKDPYETLKNEDPIELIGLIDSLARLVDIDQTPASLRGIIGQTRAQAEMRLGEARLAWLKRLWEAYQYGDRDPEVVEGYLAYGRSLETLYTGRAA